MGELIEKIRNVEHFDLQIEFYNFQRSSLKAVIILEEPTGSFQKLPRVREQKCQSFLLITFVYAIEDFKFNLSDDL